MSRTDQRSIQAITLAVIGRIQVMHPLEIVRLTALMQRTSGRAEIAIGLIDGPVALDHPVIGCARGVDTASGVSVTVNR